MEKEKDFRNFVYYDRDVDDIQIYNKEEGDIVRDNFMFGDFIFSLTEEGKVVGLEIRNVSHFLEEYGIDPSILDRLKGAKLKVVPKQDFIFIGVDFQVDEKNSVVEKRVPITHLPVQTKQLTV